MAQMRVRPDVIESLGTALARGDLTQRRCTCGLDKVMALGLVGMEEKIADTVIRLKYGNDPKLYRDASKVVLDLARNLNTLENWHMGSKLTAMTKAVLDYWLCPVCPICLSRRTDAEEMGATSTAITGTPHLQEDACDACQGSGQRRYPWSSRKARDKSERCHTTLLIALEDAERRIRDKLISKLATQIKPLL